MMQDENPYCDHEIDESTAEIISTNGDSVEIEAACQKCEYTIYGAPSISEMSVFKEQ